MAIRFLIALLFLSIGASAQNTYYFRYDSSEFKGSIKSKQLYIDSIEAFKKRYNLLSTSTGFRTINGFSILGSGDINFDTVNLSKRIDGKIDTGATLSISKIANLQSSLDAKQNVLTSGVTLRTVNNQSLLGAGNIPAIDDTTSLSNRINAKQDALISGSNIKTINGTSVLGSGNISIAGSDTSSLSYRINSKYSPIYSDSFNIKGDGSTDDAAAIQTAIGFASSTGRPLKFRKGVFLINANIQLLSNVTIEGEGDATEFRFTNGYSSPRYMFQGDISAYSNITFRNLKINCNRSGNSGAQVWGVKFNNCTNLKFEGVTFTGSKGTANLRLYLCKNVTVSNCTFDDDGAHAMQFYGGENINVINNRIQNWAQLDPTKCALSGYVLSVSNTKVIGNTFINSAGQQFAIETAGAYMDNWDISNNTFEDDTLGGSGISGQFVNSSISFNKFKNGVGSQRSGIELSGHHIECIGNIIDGGNIIFNGLTNLAGFPNNGTNLRIAFNQITTRGVNNGGIHVAGKDSVPVKEVDVLYNYVNTTAATGNSSAIFVGTYGGAGIVNNINFVGNTIYSMGYGFRMQAAAGSSNIYLADNKIMAGTYWMGYLTDTYSGIRLFNNRSYIAKGDTIQYVVSATNPIVNILSSTDTTSLSNRINAKQDALVSGTNIKTINGSSVLGSGDLTVGADGGIVGSDGIVDRIDTLSSDISSVSSYINSLASVNGSSRLGLTGSIRQQFNPSYSGIKVGGINGLAFISGADIHNSGWSLSSGQTYTYEKSISHSIGTANPAYHYVYVIEIDTLEEKVRPFSARRYLNLVGSISAAEAQPGSFYSANLTTNPITIYIHPSNNLSPNSNPRYRYEVVVREFAINGFAYNKGVYENLWVSGAGHGYGMIGAGDSTVVKNVVFDGGGTHHAVIKSGTVNNSVFLPGPNGLANSFHLVFYESDGANNYSYLRNSQFFDAPTALYAHNSGTSSAYHELLDIDNVKVWGKRGVSVDAYSADLFKKVNIRNVYAENVQRFWWGAAGEINIEGSVFRNVWGRSGVSYPSNPTVRVNMRNSVLNIVDSASASLTATGFLSSYSNTNVDARNNIFYGKTQFTGVLGTGLNFFGNLTTNQLTLKRNIFIADLKSGTGAKVLQTDRAGGSTVTNVVSDSNVYILVRGAFQWTALNPPSGAVTLNGLAEWQSGSGQDANSIAIDLTGDSMGLRRIFVDPDNGNFTLTNSTQANQIRALLAGPSNPPTGYPIRPSYEEAVSSMVNNEYKSNWRYSSSYSENLSGLVKSNDTIYTVKNGVNKFAFVLPAGGGSPTTNASDLTSGTLSDARLSSNVPLFGGNTFGSAKLLGSNDSVDFGLKAKNVQLMWIKPSGRIGFNVDPTLTVGTYENTFGKATQFTGTHSGTAIPVNMAFTVNQTANSQTMSGLEVNNTYNAGAFTGGAVNISRFRGTWNGGNMIFDLVNLSSTSNTGVVYRASGNNGTTLLYSSGTLWNTTGALALQSSASNTAINFNNGQNSIKGNVVNGKWRFADNGAATVGVEMAYTDAVLIPKGTDAQRPTGVAGYFRYNTTGNRFEGYNTGWRTLAHTDELEQFIEPSDANYTITSGYGNVSLNFYTTLTADRTVTLPTPSVNTGRRFTIRNSSPSFNILLSTTIQENSSTTISSIAPGQTVVFYSDGTLFKRIN